MKELSPKKKSYWQEIKNDKYISHALTSLYSISLGAVLATVYNDLKAFIILVVCISLVAIIYRLIYLKFFKYRFSIKISDQDLTIRNESFKREQIEYISYTSELPEKDDFLRIKVKDYEERHICIYEEFYRDNLRLFHFINDNFMSVELIKNKKYN